MTTASGATRSGATSRVVAIRSSSAMICRTPSSGIGVPPAANSAWRRLARTSMEAVKNTLTRAWGRMTDPMSRPSMTTSPRPPSDRWRAWSAARTSGTRATLATIRLTSMSRSAAVTSSPLTRTRVEPSGSGSRVRVIPRASAARAAGSSADTPRRIAATVIARYMAPVSPSWKRRRRATSRATVLLPDPIGPSIATARPALASATAPPIRCGTRWLLHPYRPACDHAGGVDRPGSIGRRPLGRVEDLPPGEQPGGFPGAKRVPAPARRPGARHVGLEVEGSPRPEPPPEAGDEAAIQEEGVDDEVVGGGPAGERRRVGEDEGDGRVGGLRALTEDAQPLEREIDRVDRPSTARQEHRVPPEPRGDIERASGRPPGQPAREQRRGPDVVAAVPRGVPGVPPGAV